MAMAYQPWRAALLPASFGGAGFKVEAGGFGGGRRLSVHEYAHSDTPFVEDLGRKARRWQITGYCIGPGYLADRDALIAVCEAEGPFTLVHPSLGAEQVHCEVCNPVEVREKGGYVVFELVFVEAGQSPDTATTTDTQAQVASAADANSAAATGSSTAGTGGIGSDAVASSQAASVVTPVTTPLPAAVGGVDGIPVAYPNSGGIGSA